MLILSLRFVVVLIDLLVLIIRSATTGIVSPVPSRSGVRTVTAVVVAAAAVVVIVVAVVIAVARASPYRIVMALTATPTPTPSSSSSSPTSSDAITTASLVSVVAAPSMIS